MHPLLTTDAPSLTLVCRNAYSLNILIVSRDINYSTLPITKFLSPKMLSFMKKIFLTNNLHRGQTLMIPSPPFFSHQQKSILIIFHLISFHKMIPPYRLASLIPPLHLPTPHQNSHDVPFAPNCPLIIYVIFIVSKRHHLPLLNRCSR